MPTTPKSLIAKGLRRARRPNPLTVKDLGDLLSNEPPKTRSNLNPLGRLPNPHKGVLAEAFEDPIPKLTSPTLPSFDLVG